jgi:hypothetical protein
VALHGASKRKCVVYHIMHFGADKVRMVWSGVVWVSGIPPSCFSSSLNFGTGIQIRTVRLRFAVIKGSEV